MQSRLIKAKKDAHRLEKILAKSTAHNSGTEAQAGGRRSAPLSPSPGAILGDWVAEERPRKDGGERTWALSRKSSNGGAGSPSAPAGGRSAAAGGAGAAAAASKGLDPRPGGHAILTIGFSFFYLVCM